MFLEGGRHVCKNIFQELFFFIADHMSDGFIYFCWWNWKHRGCEWNSRNSKTNSPRRCESQAGCYADKFGWRSPSSEYSKNTRNIIFQISHSCLLASLAMRWCCICQSRCGLWGYLGKSWEINLGTLAPVTSQMTFFRSVCRDMSGRISLAYRVGGSA